MTMIYPLLCWASISLLVANANPTFEGYRYEKPSIAFEYPAFTKLTATTATTATTKNADIKPTPTKVASEKIATKSQIQQHQQNKATMTATIQQQEKSHKLEKIEKSTVKNPTAIKETNLNIKSNKNPVTTTAGTTATTTTIKTREIKKDKLSLNQLPNTSSVSNIAAAATNTHSSSAGCAVYIPLQQQQQNNPQTKFEASFTKTKTDLSTLAEQEAALENLLNRDNGYIYRVASNVSNSALFDQNLPHTQHDDHHATKRLRLKHDHEDHHSEQSIKYCCEQTFGSLKEKYTELSLKRPEDRRLAEYIESLKEKEYFD